MRRLLAVVPLVASLLLSACDSITGTSDPDAPQDLAYRLQPSGDPYSPAGILLTWAPSRNAREMAYNVYARSGRTGSWQLRATTTSYSFHDSGIPQLQYYVASVGEENDEVGRSRELQVDERNRLPAPGSVASVSLDSAIHLAWTHYSGADAQRFESFRVYSAPYSASAGRCVDAQWGLEGMTVSSAFVASGLPNGLSRCFALSAVSTDGHESLWSPVRVDTPRPDARAILLQVAQVQSAGAAFLFHDPATQRFGVPVDAARTDADFVVSRREDGSVWLQPVRADVEVQALPQPVSELTAVDRAPPSGYGREPAEALAGHAYVFRLGTSASYRYGLVRVVHASRDVLLVDWAFQPAAGNPELLVAE